jgi:ATP-dependent Lon protease
LNLSLEEFNEHCLKPAVEMRQRIRDELYKMDDEYEKVNIEIR